MSIKTAMNAIGTATALYSLFGGNKPSTSGGKINDFMSEIRKVGVARTNLFEVVITPPRILVGSKTANVQKISLYAQGAALPGRSIETLQLRRFGYGPNEKVPYDIAFNDITFQFIGDGAGEIYRLFYNWMHGIVRGDKPIPSGLIDRQGKAPFEVNFKSDYATTIQIVQYNEKGDVVFIYRLLDAFPVQCPDVSLSWNDGSMMQFSVTFTFLQAILEGADDELIVTNNGPKELTPIQKLAKIGTAIQAISSLKAPQSVQDALSVATTVKTVFGQF